MMRETVGGSEGQRKGHGGFCRGEGGTETKRNTVFWRVGHGDWSNTGTKNTKYMGASARKGRHRDTQCTARQDTLYRNTRETGFLQEGRAWRDSGPSFEEHKEHKGHGERGEAEGQLDKSKTPRDTGPSKRWTQMDLEPAKREDTELLKERTQRNTGFSVGSTWVRSEGENGRLTTLSSRRRRLVRQKC